MATKATKPKKVSKVSSKAKLVKAVKKHNQKVEKDNLAFKKLSPSAKRVAIARDVLAHLASKKITPTNGAWVEPKLNSTSVKLDAELQEVLGEVKSCNACALGGMFMCAVERANSLKVRDLSNIASDDHYDGAGTVHRVEFSIEEHDVFSYMRKFFSDAQLELIESCFERNAGTCHTNEADHFIPDANDPAERMRLIMENIIVNNGTFKPNKAPVATYSTPGFRG